MKPLLVVYATREGHTRKIAEHVAATIRARGDAADVVDAAHLPAGFDVSRYGGVDALEAFCHETGLHPSRMWPVAGALLYREYGLLKRVAMKMIARSTGGDPDTSRDHDYTDWEALDRFVAAMTEEMERGSA